MSIAGAEICGRWLRLPRSSSVTSSPGCCWGRPCWAGCRQSVTGDLRPLILLGLGLLLFELGSRVDLRWLRHNPMLIVAAWSASSPLPRPVSSSLAGSTSAWGRRVAVAKIAVSTSPAVVMRISLPRTTRADR
ncbi:MAG: hypothetical protein IPK39_09095 [Sulfuritalea sp.]|nr:hypothetical protein [Sulfuritalea sp.]